MAVSWQTYDSAYSALVGGCVLSDGRVLFVEGVSGRFFIATIDTGSSPFITFVDSGTAIPSGMNANVSSSTQSICLLSDGRVFWGGGINTSMAATAASYFITVSGNTVTYATATSLPNATYTHVIKQIADGRLLSIGHMNDDQTVWFGTISGNTITWVATTQGPSGGVSGGNFVQLPDGRILLSAINFSNGSWATTNTPNHLGVISGNTITWTLSTATPDGGRDSCALILLSDGRVVIAAGTYYSGGNQYRTSMYVGTISSDTISWAADTTVPVSAIRGAFVNAGQKLLLFSTQDVNIAITSSFIVSGTVHNVTISEPVTASHTNVAAQAHLAALSEPATASHTNNALRVQTSSQTEPAAASHTNAATQIHVATHSEPATAAHTNTATQVHIAARSEPATAAHTNDGEVFGTLSASIVEAVSASHSNSASAIMPAARTEAATAAESASAGATLPVSRTEAASAAETSSGSTTMPAAHTEAAMAAETHNALRIAFSSVSEGATAAHSNSASAIMGAALVEAVFASETNTAAQQLFATRQEAATANATHSASAVLPAELEEDALLEDTIIGGLFNSVSITEAASAGGSGGPAQYWG